MRLYKEILLIIGIVLIYLMHIPFDSSFQKADIFLLYDYPDGGRYIANIMKESGMYFVSLIFIFLLWFETRSRLYLCFLIWWAYNVLGYLLFYGRYASVIGLPLLFILLIIHYAKARKNN